MIRWGIAIALGLAGGLSVWGWLTLVAMPEMAAPLCQLGRGESCGAAVETSRKPELLKSLAQNGCRLHDARSCRAVGLSQCEARELSAAAASFVEACVAHDRPSCRQVARFLLSASHRELIPKQPGLSQAFIAAAMEAASNGRRDDALSLMASIDALLSSAILNAGLAIDAHQYERAREQLAVAEKLGSATVEIAVLRGMLEAHEAKRPVFEAGVTEWALHGAPSMADSVALGQFEASEKTSTVDCALETTPIAKVPALGELIAMPSDVPRAQKLLLYGELTNAYSKQPKPAEVEQKLQGIREELTSASADDLWLTVWSIAQAGDRNAPLSASDMARLEAASMLDWRSPKRAVREVRVSPWTEGPDLSQMLDALLPDNTMGKRAKLKLTGRPLDERRRFALTLRRIGQKIAAGGWAVEMYIGAAWVRSAGELAEDPTYQAEAEVILADARALFPRGGAMRSFGTWPVAAARNEITDAAADDEVGFWRRVLKISRREE